MRKNLTGNLLDTMHAALLSKAAGEKRNSAEWGKTQDAIDWVEGELRIRNREPKGKREDAVAP